MHRSISIDITAHTACNTTYYEADCLCVEFTIPVFINWFLVSCSRSSYTPSEARLTRWIIKRACWLRYFLSWFANDYFSDDAVALLINFNFRLLTSDGGTQVNRKFLREIKHTLHHCGTKLHRPHLVSEFAREITLSSHTAPTLHVPACMYVPVRRNFTSPVVRIPKKSVFFDLKNNDASPEVAYASTYSA